MPRRSKSAEEDAALEIESIAARTDESVRRVRARVEKEGGPDSLMTQILERKVIDRILEETVIEDVQTTIEPEEDVETIDYVCSRPRLAAGEARQRPLDFRGTFHAPRTSSGRPDSSSATATTRGSAR